MGAHGIIDGFNLVGSKKDTQYKCETCAMAKIRRHSSKRAKCVDVPKRIGEHLSPDVKSVPYESFQGYKYEVNLWITTVALVYAIS